MSEQELAEGCRAGDNRARKELYELFAQPMLCLCFRYVANLEQAQDLLHDGFLKVFSSISSFTYQGEGSLRAWMSRVFTNVALGFLRANKLLPSLVPLETITDTADEEEEPDANRLPIDVLMRLVGNYRRVIVRYSIFMCLRNGRTKRLPLICIYRRNHRPRNSIGRVRC